MSRTRENTLDGAPMRCVHCAWHGYAGSALSNLYAGGVLCCPQCGFPVDPLHDSSGQRFGQFENVRAQIDRQFQKAAATDPVLNAVRYIRRNEGLDELTALRWACVELASRNAKLMAAELKRAQVENTYEVVLPMNAEESFIAGLRRFDEEGKSRLRATVDNGEVKIGPVFKHMEPTSPPIGWSHVPMERFRFSCDSEVKPDIELEGPPHA